MIDSQTVLSAYEAARSDLLAQRSSGGYWIGELASSALSTATAVSALALAERRGKIADNGRFAEEAYEAELRRLIVRGLEWLADAQNPDGGWGDTDKSYSNIATTMLVRAAFYLTGVPADHADLLARAEHYIKAQGGIAALRQRYGKDKTFAAPILTNCALAGLVSWKEVSPLPFELACLPQKWYRLLRLPVVSYAIPALVAIGQARFFHRPPWNPLVAAVRRRAVQSSLRVLERMQPASGGFLEATPLTSFVVMSLASIGQADHPVTRRGIEFLIHSVRDDGSWPIDTNLATWNTTLALNALEPRDAEARHADCLDWLLACQNRQVHPYTGCEPGGWGWSDLSGSVPDADDTSGALLALANWPVLAPQDQRRVQESAAAGIAWLLDLQNGDGGWPTFCRGWGTMPFDRSGSDLTAHALRALHAWGTRSQSAASAARIETATRRGIDYLQREQRGDGSWTALWFGNQDHPQEENLVYGTARVLLAYRDLGRIDSLPAQRGLKWLLEHQNADGGWGGWLEGTKPPRSSVEETALAVEALVADPVTAAGSLEAGLAWLVQAVTGNRLECSPIGFYFAKLWYYERLYPLTFTASALRQAARLKWPTIDKPALGAGHSPAQTAHV